MEINKEIEHHTQQRYPITYASKDKGKLVESPTNLSYHYTPRSAINITSTSVATSNTTSAFGQFSFQSKQRKAELLEPYGTYFEGFNLIFDLWKVTELEEKKEKEAKDQEFTY
ncbi:hypothetical protein G9A89_015929 [Geosiphon pyriformis]|nr:hypothetical protein G9A89_015929 [Geosiphon pyriformis]